MKKGDLHIGKMVECSDTAKIWMRGVITQVEPNLRIHPQGWYSSHSFTHVRPFAGFDSVSLPTDSAETTKLIRELPIIVRIIISSFLFRTFTGKVGDVVTLANVKKRAKWSGMYGTIIKLFAKENRHEVRIWGLDEPQFVHTLNLKAAADNYLLKSYEPGTYEIIKNATVRENIWRESKETGVKLCKGERVSIIGLNQVGARIRARLQSGGWISIRDIHTSYMSWAKKGVPELKVAPDKGLALLRQRFNYYAPDYDLKYILGLILEFTTWFPVGAFYHHVEFTYNEDGAFYHHVLRTYPTDSTLTLNEDGSYSFLKIRKNLKIPDIREEAEGIYRFNCDKSSREFFYFDLHSAGSDESADRIGYARYKVNTLEMYIKIQNGGMEGLDFTLKLCSELKRQVISQRKAFIDSLPRKQKKFSRYFG